MADVKPLDDSSWVNRLPGHPGGRVSPSWGTPEGLYQYIIQSVPGISPQAAQWMHSQIFGGRGVTNDTLQAQVNGLTPGQMMAINSLTPFSQGASNVQPDVPGGAHFGSNAGPLVPGTPGQQGWTNYTPPPPPPPPPPVNVVPPGDPRWVPTEPIGPFPPYGTGPGQVGINQPPPVPMPGWNTPGVVPPGGIDFGNYPHPNPGAALPPAPRPPRKFPGW